MRVRRGRSTARTPFLENMGTRKVGNKTRQEFFRCEDRKEQVDVYCFVQAAVVGGQCTLGPRCQGLDVPIWVRHTLVDDVAQEGLLSLMVATQIESTEALNAPRKLSFSVSA